MEQVGVGQIATSEEQRIIFVEPNDVYDKDADNAQGGISLTPKYEDFCISFNLIIEAFSRFKSSGKAVDGEGTLNDEGNVKTYSIEWGLTREDMKKRRTAVLQGDRGKDNLLNPDGSFAYSDSDYNYLTTYYTDLTFDSYKEKTQIEGLGVESVQISYESWYTPTVTIKFVDVRGSALFGREEAIHVDERLTAENIFGAFFTMPYPLFRLQVKGFLGKPVTYQLTCSNFKGEFNSQTGNFEAVATFIGYSWSIMTDIPFTYLVAAPNATYLGMDYWERHKNTREWGLWDDGNVLLAPPKLVHLFKWIKEADQRIEERVSASTTEQNEKLQSLENEKKLLNDLKTYLNDFITAIQSQVDSNFLGLYFDQETKKQQLLIFSNAQTLTLSQETIKKYDDMYVTLQEYTTSYTGKFITTDKAPNKWKNAPKEITLLDKFNVECDTEGNVKDIKVKELSSLTTNGLQSLVFNEKDGVLTKKTAEGLYVALTSEQKSSQIKKYAYLIDLYDINTLINDRLKVMVDEERRIVKEITEQVNYHVKDILGFKPYIGNIFKIIFCHLETFCHIMFDSADEIYTQIKKNQRTPSFLKVNMENTDLMRNVNENITPWPAVYDNGVKTEECGHISDLENVYGWVGDFSHDFVEEKVVLALQQGIQNIVDNATKDIPSLKQNVFPVLPSDIVGSPFGLALQTNISDLSAYMSMRAASNIGVLCGNNIDTNMATLLGKLDAYNFYSSNGRTEEIDNIFANKTLADVKGISYCDQKYDVWGRGIVEGTGKRYHIFETVKKIRDDYNKNGRKPMFKESNGNNLFVHWYDNKQISYVPSVLKDFNNYKADFEYDKNVDGVNPYFIPNLHEETNDKVESFDWIYNCDSTKVSVVNSENRKKYINKSMFTIIDNDKKVDAIIQKYDEFKTGGCKVFDYEIKDDLNEYADTFLKVGKKYKTKFYNGVSRMLSGNKEKLNISDEDLISNASEDREKIVYNLAYTGWDARQNKDLENEVRFNDEGNLMLNDEETTISNLAIQQFKIIHFGCECNIFGSPFYYLQNNRIGNEDDTQYNYRKARVKALLFLHTFRYDYLNTDLNVFSRMKKVGGFEIVPKGYLLFLGAMLWRRRYIQEHNSKDPIIYKSSSDTDVYKEPGIDKTLFVNRNGKLFFETIRSNDKTLYYTYDVRNLFAGLEDIDCNIENQLILLFERFATTTFANIASRYELRNRISSDSVVEYTSVTLKQDIVKVNEFIKNYYKDKYDGLEFQKWMRTEGIDNWEGHYSAINTNPDVDIRNQGLKMLFNENDKETQNLFKNLYVNGYVVCDSCHRVMGKDSGNVTTDDQIWVNSSLYDAYISGFLSGIRDVVDNNAPPRVDGETRMPDSNVKNRDLSIAIYYYLKNLWDKWLVIADNNAFDVSSFFEKNFVFTDSFYTNTYHKLAINCQLLLEAWEQLADNASLFHFISRIVTDHKCIFLPVPDYIGFNGETQKHDIEMMEDLFRPLPYSAVGAPSNSNKFVIMFTHSPSSIQDEENGYKTDSYDIWSHTEGFTETAKRLFQKTNSEEFDRENGMATREGYNVPSFGISFGRQNNHIFKNLKVTMDNPVMTEQSIKATWQIAQMGSGGGRKVHFVGQDTFNVFTNYSYSIDVEMLGNAQICPLMYFQLMNVPMWRGTYMIYKVVHNMTPGNMITTFTGMKMSKYAKPFNSTFFAYNPYAKIDDNSGGELNAEECDGVNEEYIENGIVEGVYGQPGVFYGKSDKEKLEMCGINDVRVGPQQVKNEGLIIDVTFNQTGGTKTLPMNKYIAEDFKNICDEILATGFKLNVGNCYRDKNSVSGGVSRHCWGLAVDINPGSGGNPWFATHISKIFNSVRKDLYEGCEQPWPTKSTHYYGTYDSSKCIWSWNHPVVEIFIRHGWGWGGAYGDTMHFSIDGR